MSPKSAALQKAVILLSGGLDSAVSLAQGVQDYEVVLALTFNYGQRAFGKEIRASRMLSEYYRVPHEVIALPWLSALLPKALRPGLGRESTIPYEWTPQQPEKSDAFFDAKSVWVPNRNGVFLNIAAAYAETYAAPVILFGANAEEGEQFPDNTEAFRERMNAAFALSTLGHPRVECPLVSMHKAEIIDKAITLDVPLNLIWSCYSDTEYQCGECPSCYRLKTALDKVQAQTRLRVKVAFMA